MLFKNSFLAIAVVIIILNSKLSAQQDNFDFKIKSKSQQLNILSDHTERSSLSTLGVIAVFFPVNPIFLIENKKFYVGITKEFSLSFYPAGRIAAEYSLIFRKTHLNQLRFSYNYDIPLVASDYAAIYMSLGGGYFTDFDKDGYFPQASFNILLPASDVAAVSAYFKLRNTFVSEDKGSDIFDVSLGLGTTFSF